MTPLGDVYEKTGPSTWTLRTNIASPPAAGPVGPACRVYDNVGTSIPSGGWTLVPWKTLDYDTLSTDTGGVAKLWDSAAGSPAGSQFTIPTTGKWNIDAQVAWTAQAGVSAFGWLVGIFVNGVQKSDSRMGGTISSGSYLPGAQVHDCLHLNAGDVVTIRVWNSSAGAQPLQGGMTCYCAIRMVSGLAAVVSRTNLTLLNSWANYGAGYEVAYLLRDTSNLVSLHGLVAHQALTTGNYSNPIANIPAGMRPAAQVIAECWQSPYGIVPQGRGRIDVTTAGDILAVSPWIPGNMIALSGSWIGT